MIIRLQVLKGGETIFTYSFASLDKSQMPDHFEKAIAAFYEAAPDLSLLDPEVSIKLDAPWNKETPLYG